MISVGSRQTANKFRQWLVCLAVALGGSFCPWQAGGPCFAGDEFEQPPIEYSNRESNDPVAVLQRKMKSGEVVLTMDDRFGYLPSLLQALNVRPESQVLVFSKTSLQIHKISPTNPRAVYFNDSVYVGHVPGSDTLELSANDPQLGAVFYTFDTNRDDPAIESADTYTASVAGSSSSNTPSTTSKEAGPRILRDRGQCLSCHATSRTENVPGHLVRSIYPDRSGRARTGSTSYSIDDRTPFEHRWGGWYVTGSHGSMRHMGNIFAVDRDDPQLIDADQGANLQSLPSRVRSNIHLTPHSDLVALMVLEHQARVHNLITRAGFETRQATYLDEVMNKALDRPAEYRSESTIRRIESAGNALLASLFMIDEYRLTAPVAGTSRFAEVFAEQGPKTKDGRSLRDLDLHNRLFRYPMSYLVYTPEFRALPDPMMAYLKKRIAAVLGNEHVGAPYEQLSDEDRVSIRAILEETYPELVSGQ